MSLDALSQDDRLRLLRFVCSFAWADLHVHPRERALIAGLIQRLHLGPEDRARVDEWIDLPPAAQDVDPTSVPMAHRLLFRQAVAAAVLADGRVTEEERDAMELFDLLTRPSA
jgi:uncharacterized membrane protein YebE (DUF533 family)